MKIHGSQSGGAVFLIYLRSFKMDLFFSQLTTEDRRIIDDLLNGGESCAFNKDNRVVLEALPDESIDLIVTDPPYKDYQSNRPVARKKVKKIEGAHFDLPYFIEQSNRLLKPGAHFYCWCDHRTFPEIFLRIQRLEEEFPAKNDRLNYKNCLIWVKNNHGSGDLKGDYAPQHEFVIFAVKGKGKPLNGKRKPNVLFKKTENGIEFYPKISNYNFDHGTTKPVEILNTFIEASSKINDLVLDPYAGTFSTGVACAELERRFILIELEEKYCSVGMKRINRK